jgi:hypothetical protein
MATFHKGHNCHLALELRRDAKKVTVIYSVGTPMRRVREVPLAQFEKEGWKPYFYDVKKAALTWLENAGYIELSESAKKELAMLLIIKDAKVVSAHATEEAAQPTIDATTGQFEAVISIEELMEFTGKDLTTLYNSLLPPDAKQLARTRDKAEIAAKVWEMSAKLVAELPPPKPTPAVKTAPSGPKEKRKMGIKEQIREKLEAGEKLTMEQLVAEFGDDKKTSIATAISDLKSDRYSGPKGPLAIAKDANKAYYAEVPEPDAAA